MGVLEDAIREHLDLKRQHGASEEEVEAQQSEVLGASEAAPAEAAKGPLAEGEEAAAPDSAVDEAPAAVPMDDSPEPDDSLEDAEPPEPEEDAPAALDISEPEPAPAEFAADFDDPPAPGPQPAAYDEEEELQAFDEDEPGAAPPMPATPESAVPESAEGGKEDLLEDTPEFLQETPEHDRLWFEQKPPRDFDFD